MVESYELVECIRKLNRIAKNILLVDRIFFTLVYVYQQCNYKCSQCLDAAKIAVVEFSAGGHLAACAATVAEHKPALWMKYHINPLAYIQE